MKTIMMYNTFSVFITCYLCLVVVVSSHPIQQQQQQQEDHSEQKRDEKMDNIIESLSEQEDRIQVELFAQLVSTHWQFDHLDSIMSTGHKEMADRIQDHIDINIQPHSAPSSRPPLTSETISVESSLLSPWQSSLLEQSSQRPMMVKSEHMEYELLKTQMMNAIQSRTQGQLPELWDQVGEALGRPAMEAYVQRLLRSACPHHEDWVTLACLEEHASSLSSELDDYVQHHLATIWSQLQEEIPELLSSMVNELEQLVAYFNKDAFFSHHNIVLTVLPWSPSSSSLPLSSLDDHSLFSNFMTLAKL